MNDGTSDLSWQPRPPRRSRRARLTEHLVAIAIAMGKNTGGKDFFSVRKDCGDLTRNIRALLPAIYAQGGFKIYESWRGLGLKWKCIPWIIRKARIRGEIWIMFNNLEAEAYDHRSWVHFETSNAYIRRKGELSEQIRITRR